MSTALENYSTPLDTYRSSLQERGQSELTRLEKETSPAINRGVMNAVQPSQHARPGATGGFFVLNSPLASRDAFAPVTNADPVYEQIPGRSALGYWHVDVSRNKGGFHAEPGEELDVYLDANEDDYYASSVADQRIRLLARNYADSNVSKEDFARFEILDRRINALAPSVTEKEESNLKAAFKKLHEIESLEKEIADKFEIE